MALLFAHGAVQWLTTDTLSSTKVVTGLGFSPKAIRFYWVGLQNAADALSEAVSARRGVGFAVDASNRRCIGTFSLDGAAAADTDVVACNDAVVVTTNGAAARDGLLDLTAIGADGFTLTVDDVTPANLTVFWEAWGGTDITSVVLGDITEPAANGAVNYTVNGFTPDGANQVVMFAGCQSTTTMNTAQVNDAGWHVGFATGTGNNQITVCGNSDEASTTIDTDGYCQTGQCLSMIVVAGGTSVNARAALTAWGTDQFTLDWTRATTGRRTVFMAIKGGNWNAGSVTIAGNSASSTATVSGLSYAPLGMSLLGNMRAQNTANTSTAPDRLAFGSGSSTSSRRTMSVYDEDSVANTEVDTTIQYDQVLAYPSATATLLTAYDINAMNSDGFQLITDVAGGVASEWIGYLTFGSVPLRNYPHPIQLGGVFREPTYVRHGRGFPKARRLPLNWYGGEAVAPPSALVESNAIIDAFTASVVYNGILAETSAITDAPSATNVTAAVLAESHTITDAPSASYVAPVALAESHAIADAPDATRTLPAALVESHAIADALSATAVATAALAETNPITDAPSATNVTAATLAESHAIADAPSALTLAPATLTETNAITDTTDGQKLILGDLAESSAVTDQVTGAATLPVVLAESHAVTDVVGASATMPAALSESHAVSDSTDGTKVQPVDLTETNSISDATDAVRTLVATVAETNPVVDTTSAATGAIAVMSDTNAITDTVTALTLASVILAESHAVSDTMDGTKIQPVNIAESNAVTDAPSATVLYGGLLAESAAVTDAPSASMVTTVAITETNPITDVPSAERLTTATLSDTNAIVDSTSAAIAIPADFADTMASSDIFGAVMTVAANIVEAATIEDAFDGFITFLVALEESMSITDMIRTGGPQFASIEESVSISDFIDFVRFVRVYTVNPEHRALLIAAENRLLTLNAEDRVKVIDTENRNQEI
jgi:hypothetical protein